MKIRSLKRCGRLTSMVAAMVWRCERRHHLARDLCARIQVFRHFLEMDPLGAFLAIFDLDERYGNVACRNLSHQLRRCEVTEELLPV